MNDTKQTSKAPAFSVIMPTYNRAFCIKTAIDSLLNQTYQQFELIIVDDGSTDRTEQLIQKNYQKYLKSGKFKYIKLNHVGVSAARNVGIKEAKNEWITYLDTDNYLLSNALGVYSYNISKNPGQQNFYGKFISKTTKEIYGKLFNFEDIKKQNTIDLGVYLHTKNLIEKCGAFDETLKRFVDWEMIARHCASSHPILIDEIVMEYNDSTKIKRITTSEKYSDTYIKAYEKVKKLVKGEFKAKITASKQKKVESYFFKIVVPNYNNLPYIQRCLDSILKQTFQDFKIIVVDDLSTDGSDKFCEMYARKYSNKIVYLQVKEKHYAGAARNLALKYNLNSKFVLFLDGDDEFTNNGVFQNIYDYLKKHNAVDFLKLDFNIIDVKNQTTIEKTFTKSTLLNFEAPWSACVRSECSALFVEDRWKYNDVVWYMRTYLNCKHFSALNKICVNYYVNQNAYSVQTGYLAKSEKTCIAIRQLIDDLSKIKTNNSIVKERINKIIRDKKAILQNVNKQNLKYSKEFSSVIDKKTKIKIPKIGTPEQTILKLIETDNSIIRFGDGEFFLMKGMSYNIFEKPNKEITTNLIQIVKDNSPQLMIGLPYNIFYGIQYPNLEHTSKFWTQMCRQILKYDLLSTFDCNKMYYDSNFALGYHQLTADRKYFEYIYSLIQAIFKDKNVIIASGEDMSKYTGNLFSQSKTCKYINFDCPKNAYQQKDTIYQTLKTYKDHIIVMCLGPAGKIIGYNLFKNEQIRILDFGHAIKCYDRFLRKIIPFSKEDDNFYGS